LFVLFRIEPKGHLMKVHFIDVERGDAILIELPEGQVMLIDSGSERTKEKLVFYLKEQGIEKIDLAILTHPHYDHFGGFDALVESVPIKTFYYNGDERSVHDGYFDVMDKIKSKGLKPIVLRKGEEIFPQLKDVYIKILHPESLKGETNENAVVTWMVYKNTSFLLTSDLQFKGQDSLIEEFEEISSADVIQIPHHGGKLSDAFVGLTKDKILVVSTGEGGKGPQKPFENELAKCKGMIYRTDKEGTVVISSNGKRIKISNE